MVFLSLLAACGQGGFPGFTPTETATVSPSPSATATLAPTETQTVTPTPLYPPEGLGPQFPADVDPLTGLKVDDPALLERRPLAIQVSNLPRSVRPQWGLSLADHVYEYYTEEGTTRFTAVFLGRDASQVGPIRSARVFDAHIIRMYKAIFAFGSGDYLVRLRLYNADFYDRLVSEFPAKCPPMCRYDPGGADYLITNTSDLTDYINAQGVANGRQNLDGLFFKLQPPDGAASPAGDAVETATPEAQPADRVFVYYSRAIYNLWDYDPATGRYVRLVDKQDVDDSGREVYLQLADRLTHQPITAENVVVLYVPHRYISVYPEVVDIHLDGPNDAYVFRDGRMYKVRWQRRVSSTIVQLVYEDKGELFPLKPGNTWFEVVGAKTDVDRVADGWRFVFKIP
jgi:hypothetical protein